MKAKRLSLGVKIASILSAVAILSVGFASWLIVNIPQPEAETIGSFTVHEVVDKSVSLSYDWGVDGDDTDDVADATINFGTVDAETTYNWFRPESNVGAEKLSAKVAVSITNFDQLASFSVKLGVPSAYTGLGSTLVADPSVTLYAVDGSTALDVDVADDGTVTVAASEMAADADGSNVCTIVVEVEFGWGSAFTIDDAVVNPYVYYNSMAYSESNVSDAMTKLNAIESALNGVGYDITFTCTGAD